MCPKFEVTWVTSLWNNSRTTNFISIYLATREPPPKKDTSEDSHNNYIHQAPGGLGDYFSRYWSETMDGWTERQTLTIPMSLLTSSVWTITMLWRTMFYKNFAVLQDEMLFKSKIIDFILLNHGCLAQLILHGEIQKHGLLTRHISEVDSELLP